MEYYKKDDLIFYKLDSTQNTYLEVFNNNNSQFRVMKINDTILYNQLIQRIQQYDFETCTQQVFEDKLSITLQQIQ